MIECRLQIAIGTRNLESTVSVATIVMDLRAMTYCLSLECDTPVLTPCAACNIAEGGTWGRGGGEGEGRRGEGVSPCVVCYLAEGGDMGKGRGCHLA